MRHMHTGVGIQTDGRGKVRQGRQVGECVHVQYMLVVVGRAMWDVGNP